MKELDSFKKLHSLFLSNSFSLYFVGGSVRDYLLENRFFDLDLVTNATPNDMRKFLKDADFSFEKYGYVKLKFEELIFDIVTLRKEEKYSDSRHPNKIIFIDSLKEDVIRRDFTINALYMDENLNVIDYVNGQEDLKNRTLKIIGNANDRLKEDPLRIIRALRFVLTYKLSFDSELEKSIYSNKNELEKLNIEKIKQDISKIKNSSKEEIYNLFDKFGIKKYLDVIKL